MNWIKWLIDTLNNDPAIFAITQWRVSFMYHPKEDLWDICVVFSEWKEINRFWDKASWIWWVDEFDILIDVTCKYWTSWQWRQLRDMIKKKLSWQNDLYDDRCGYIWRKENLWSQFDPETERVLRWAVYRLQSTY